MYKYVLALYWTKGLILYPLITVSYLNTTIEIFQINISLCCHWTAKVTLSLKYI